MQPFWGRSSFSILLQKEIFWGRRPMGRVYNMVANGHDDIRIGSLQHLIRIYQQTRAWGCQLGWRHFQQTANSGWMGIHVWLWSLFSRTSRRPCWIWSCRKNIAKAGCKFKLIKVEVWFISFQIPALDNETCTSKFGGFTPRSTQLCAGNLWENIKFSVMWHFWFRRRDWQRLL